MFTTSTKLFISGLKFCDLILVRNGGSGTARSRASVFIADISIDRIYYTRKHKRNMNLKEEGRMDFNDMS